MGDQFESGRCDQVLLREHKGTPLDQIGRVVFFWAPAAKPKAETVEPMYQPDGTACCPVHKRALSDGQYGLYCSARAKPGGVANGKGYCALRFVE
jgi:hypothetical protein